MRLATRIAFLLFALMIVCLGAATFVERAHGSDFVAGHVYHSWWFTVLWGAMFAVAMAAIVARSLHRRQPLFLLHASFGVILTGALLTFLTAEKGIVHLREGVPAGEFRLEEGGIQGLPFEMSLDEFEVEYYKGTEAPADYVSRVTVAEGTARTQHMISMNNILRHRGYRFYQASFDEDGHGSTLSVNRDPWGIPVTYAGYILLGISMLWTLLSRQGGFRRLLRDPRFKKMGAAIVLLFTVGAAQAAPATLTREQADAFGRLQMLYDGRIAPVQTFARDFTLKLCGKPRWGDFSAEQVLAGWIFYPEQWQHEPMVRVKSAEVRRIAGSGEMAPFTAFFDEDRRYKLAPYMDRVHGSAGGEKRWKAVAETDEKVQLIAMLQAGEYLPLLPVRTPDGLRWYSPADPLGAGVPRGDSLFVKGIFPLMYQALLTGQGTEVGTLISKIAAFQQWQGGTELLSARKLKVELWYNRMDFATMLYRLNLCFGLLAFFYFCWSMTTGRRSRWLQALFLIQLIHSLAFVTVALVLRGYIAGHVPLSNGYETMMFIAWCVLLITVIFRRKFFLINASGFILSGFALLVSALGAMNPQITPLMPVLASPWLSIHVSLIMVSYALFGFVTLNALAALSFWLAARPATKEKVAAQVENLQLVSRLFLYPAVFLLAAGIFVGAVWANVSWGRYWGWDPKEVWALITMMVYALPLHGASLRWFNRPLFFHGYAIVAFYSVLMTYFGVNYLLGGMHSYAGETSIPSAAWLVLLPIAVIVAAGVKSKLFRSQKA